MTSSAASTERKARIDTHYGGAVVVHCDDKYNGGQTSRIYAEGVENNVKAFHASIVQGDFSNPTVALVRSSDNHPRTHRRLHEERGEFGLKGDAPSLCALGDPTDRSARRPGASNSPETQVVAPAVRVVAFEAVG